MKTSYWAGIAGGVVAFLVTLSVVFGSWFTIDQGDRGVVLRNGAFARVAEPGLGFKFPFIDTVHEVSIRDETLRYTKGIETYSYDQQPAYLKISVVWRVPADAVRDVYTLYGSRTNLQQRLLEPKIVDSAKIVFGKYTASGSIQRRAELVQQSNDALKAALAGAPITIMGLQIEDISFSDAYVKSIEQRMLAEVQIQTTRQQKETATVQAEIQVVNAKAEADAKRERFQADADGIRMRGEAEALAIDARAKALAANTNLVQLSAVERWDGKLPATMLPNSALPFVGVK